MYRVEACIAALLAIGRRDDLWGPFLGLGNAPWMASHCLAQGLGIMFTAIRQYDSFSLLTQPPPCLTEEGKTI